MHLEKQQQVWHWNDGIEALAHAPRRTQRYYRARKGLRLVTVPVSTLVSVSLEEGGRVTQGGQWWHKICHQEVTEMTQFPYSQPFPIVSTWFQLWISASTPLRFSPGLSFDLLLSKSFKVYNQAKLWWYKNDLVAFLVPCELSEKYLIQITKKSELKLHCLAKLFTSRRSLQD